MFVYMVPGQVGGPVSGEGRRVRPAGGGRWVRSVCGMDNFIVSRRSFSSAGRRSPVPMHCFLYILPPPFSPPQAFPLIIMRSLAILPLVTAVAMADRLLNPAPQVFFPDPDDALHPDWPHRQSALGWDTLGRINGDVAIGGGVGSCGGVCVLTPEVMEVGTLG